MEDFATFCKNQQSLLSKVFSLKMSKDRFWNFVFWFGMSVGFSTASAIKGLPSIASMVFWLTLVFVPLAIFFFSKTTFIKDSIFLTKEGRKIDIKKDLPTRFPIVVTTVAFTVLTVAVLDKIGTAIPTIVAVTILINVFFLIPTLFFVFKNCPISILFNRKLWSYIAANALKSSPRSNLFNSRNHTNTPVYTNGLNNQYNDYRYNPAYSAYSSNIYHRQK